MELELKKKIGIQHFHTKWIGIDLQGFKTELQNQLPPPW